MKEFNLVKCTSANSYCEESQDILCKISWLKKVNDDIFEQLFVPVKCKDYLDDLLVCNKLGLKLNQKIYGFKYNKPIDLEDDLYISVLLEPECVDRVLSGLKILNEYEGEDKTVGYRVIDSDDTLIIKMPKFWLQSPLLSSIYNFIIRCLSYNEDNLESIEELFEHILSLEDNSKDRKYIKEWVENCNIDFLLRNIDIILGDNPLTGIADSSITQNMCNNIYGSNSLGFSMEDTHNYIGFKSFAKNMNVYRNLKNGLGKHTLGIQWLDNYIKLKDVDK